jgi:Tfp pilus assembly protein PilO
VNRRLVAFIALGVLLVTVLWYFFLISPKNSKIGELNDELDTAVAEEQALRVALATLESVKLNDVAYLAAIGQMEAGIPDEPELAVFIEEVTALAEETGIDLTAIAPAQPTAVAELPLYQITVALQMEGEYFELLGFLFGLDDMERIVVVDAIAVSGGGGGGGEEVPSVELPGEAPEETTTTTSTTTTVAGGSTTTTVAGETTTTTSTTTTTTSTTTTTTTLPAIDENRLTVSLTVSLFTRSPLIAIAEVETEQPDAAPVEGGDQEAGEFGQAEFGIGGEDAPSNVEDGS